MKFQTLYLSIALVVSLLIHPLQADEFEETVIEVTRVQGKALVRKSGEYLWKKSTVGQELCSGDHLQLRQGEISISFPKARLTIFNEGRIELPRELANSNTESLGNDLVLHIGRYAVQNFSQHSLKITTSFGEITAGPGAAFGIQNTTKATTVKVLSGKLKLRHRWKPEVAEQQLESGENAIIFSGGIDLHL